MLLSMPLLHALKKTMLFGKMGVYEKANNCNAMLQVLSAECYRLPYKKQFEGGEWEKRGRGNCGPDVK